MVKECFAMNKKSKYNTLSETKTKKRTCYALKHEVFYEMRDSGLCCTRYCPFYKEKRGDVRLD